MLLCTASLFHILWKRRWKTKKSLMQPHFPGVGKPRRFQHGNEKIPVRHRHRLHFFPFVFTPSFSFHIFYHIFPFSTGHLFKNFHRKRTACFFPQDCISFSHLIPPKKQSCRISKIQAATGFFRLSNFSTQTITITSKKVYNFFFYSAKKEIFAFSDLWKEHLR